MLSQLLNISNYYFNPYAIPVMLVSILIFTIGIFVFWQNKRSPTNIAFFSICLSTGLWLFTISIVYSSRISGIAILWYRYFTFFGVANIMPSLLLFSAVSIGKLSQKRFFLVMDYLISLIFYGLVVSTGKLIPYAQIRKYFWGYYPVYTFWIVPFLLFFLFQIIITIAELNSAYKKELIPIKKMSKKIILIASLIGFTAPVDFLPKLFNLPWLYPYGYISMFIYISLVAYSIVRYRAFDIETVIHKTLVWLFSFSFIIIPVFLLYRWVFPYMRGSHPLQILYWIISFFALALYLRLAQPKIDHFFQRRKSNLEEISSRFTEDLVHLKGLNQLIQRIEDTIADTLYPQRIDIFIYNEDIKVHKLANVINTQKEILELKGEDRFLAWLAKNNKITYKEFIGIDPAYTLVKDTAENYFNLLEAIVVIPLVLNEKLLGVVNLGKKANLRRYSASDLHFLTTLKNQATIAISNSLLYENMEEQVRQRTKELVEIQKQLIQAEKLATVGTLAGGVAHEINNPLTAILTNVQMLLASDDAIDAKLDRESLELIEEATKRCRTIVQKLMAYAKKPLEPAKVSEIDLLKTTKNVISFLGYQLEQENIKIIIKAKEDGYLVMGNQNELEQMLTNIILNAKDAVKQIKKSGNIYITLSESNDRIKLEIKDEGVGIPKEIMPKIFDPFFTTKEVGKGVGLGLSICQAIVEKHQGLIVVQSEVNKGTVVTIKIPKAKEKILEKGRYE